MNSEPERLATTIVEVSIPDFESLRIVSGQLGLSGKVKLLLPQCEISGGPIENSGEGNFLEGTITAFFDTPSRGIGYYIKRTSDGVLVCLTKPSSAQKQQKQGNVHQ